MDSNELKLINDGERSLSLSDLMDLYGQDVWNFAFLLTRKKEIADDISQEVFINAYLHFDRFRWESSIKSWLLTITKNKVRDYKRSAFFRKVVLFDIIFTKESYRSAEEESLSDIVSEDIWKKVIQLPDKLKEILVLYAHYDLSLKEISHILNVPVGTVKSRLYHARRRMALMMGEDGHEYKLGEEIKTT